MSEGILKALIQLFALIAYPRNGQQSRRAIVRAFLSQQLNKQLTEEYLILFDTYCIEQERKLLHTDHFRKSTSANSVKVLRIATNINHELTHYQKVFVLIQLIEFLNSGEGISDFEQEFIETVALTFNIPAHEIIGIINFILNALNNIPSSNYSLLLNDNNKNDVKGTKHLYWEHLDGNLRFLHIESADLYIFRFDAHLDLNMNGQLIPHDRVHILRPGSSLRNQRIDSIYYSDILGQFTNDNISTPVTFEAKEVEYYFNKRIKGLNPTSFTSQSGKLVGIIGASGAGKSTLVNVLCGSNAPSSGNVLLNGIDIHKNPKEIEGLIGYVSQDDLLIEDLTVYQNLYFNAKLCFDNLSSFQLKRKVLKILRSLGLYEIRNMKVGCPLDKKISGGQRKRLNIALELIREPAILFLDEPTSGLSSRGSDNIMDLLKELSVKGKLVFVVIHQPSSDTFKMFNQLLVLDTGGYMIYNGDPVESIKYFKASINHANKDEAQCPKCGTVNAEQVLNIVNAQVVDEYGHFTQTRRIEPNEWYNRFKNTFRLKTTKTPLKKELPKVSFKIPNRIKQFFLFLRRDVAAKLANKQYLLINLFETPLLAFLLAFIIRYYDVDASNTSGYTFANNPNITTYIIMAVIIAIFVGLTVSAEEIINDRKIRKREAFLNLSRFSYLLSKVTLLAGLSAIQTLLFVWIGNTIIELKGMYFHYWLILFSSSVFANILGLNISDTLKKTVNVYILIPFLIIPQLILSGVFISFDRLNPGISSPEHIPWYGELITSRWAFEALAVHQFKNNEYEKNFFTYDKLKSEASFKKDYWIPALINHLEKAHNHYLAEEPNKDNASLLLLKHELSRQTLKHPSNTKEFSTENYIETFNDSLYQTTKAYLDKQKNFYRSLYNKADAMKDQKHRDLTRLPAQRDSFLLVKNAAYNEDLERFMRNSNDFFSNKIIDYKNRLLQKVDPIFLVPESRFIKAHFFAPKKRLITLEIDTYYMNLIVIWLLNLLLLLTLYFKVFPRVSKIGKNIKQKINKLQ